jgi:hypothetical protein
VADLRALEAFLGLLPLSTLIDGFGPPQSSGQGSDDDVNLRARHQKFWLRNRGTGREFQSNQITTSILLLM